MSFSRLLHYSGGFLLSCLVAGLAPSALAVTEVLIVTGLPGEAQFAESFTEQSRGLQAAFERTGAQVTLLDESRSNRDALAASLAAAANRLRPDDRLVFVYVGHGSYDGRQFKFNLPGPDVSAQELAGWLDAIAAWQLLIVASSASGAVLEVLADDRRSLMTATRSGDQSNITVFGGYLLSALENHAADINKDQQLSLQEVFDFTARSVAEHYERRRLMATEHPQLVNARALFTMNRLDPLPQDPALVALVSRRDGIESAIEELKDRKSSMTPEAYFAELQQLLLDLALLQQQLDSGESM